MSQYDTSFTSTRLSRNNPPDSFVQTSNGERLEERAASLSSSDDGGAVICSNDAEIEEDVALTSQTLNADGTPKRPMNAFMIFARRRRPQVSAENQSMRTGEISKLLSKEWTSMPMSEKQFYLEQAKILKENFNSKYPDYVYRRRPNNSRKKSRRGDIGPLRQLDGTQSLEDMAGHDLGESSQTEEDSVDPTIGYPLSRAPHDVSQAYSDHHGRYGALSSRYNVDSDTFRAHSSHDNRIPYPSPSDRLPQDHPSSLNLVHPRLSQSSHGSYHYSYQNQPSGPSSMYALNSSESWQQHKTWSVSGNPDRMLSSIGGTAKVDPYPPSSASHHSWHSSAPSNGSSSNPYPFQGLPSQFPPTQSHLSGYSSSPSPIPGSGSSSHYEGSTHGNREYDNRPFAPSPSISPVNSYAPSRGSFPYSRQQSVSRGVTSVPGISSFNHAGMHPPDANPQDYWNRG